MKHLELSFDVHFGGVGQKSVPLKKQDNKPENDSDEDAPTSEYVKDVLGFDPDENNYLSAGAYKSLAKERIKELLAQEDIRHRWKGKELYVHPEDYRTHGKKYGWSWEQKNLFK